MSLKLWLPLTSSTIENCVPTKINITKRFNVYKYIKIQ